MNMGNEKSLPSDLQIEETIKVHDCWTQKAATLQNGALRICIFEQCLQSDKAHLLQKFSKNLMLHRHPYILKYMSSWKTNKILYVATEHANPLMQTVTQLMPMQLCIGLYNILKAVTFLQEKALSCHNNISKDAVYVTMDECWKLGRLELLASYFSKNCKTEEKSNVDQRSFALLAQELLEGRSDEEIPGVTEFRELCKAYVTAENPNSQFFRQLFAHPFFTHQFIKIYSCLAELPAMNEAEKAEFFKTVAEELFSFPEELVARQLGALLLSRLVLLNATAQTFLLPRILSPRNEDNPSSLFTVTIMQKYILPRLSSIFSIRDSQIRLILLQYFSSFYLYFPKEQLETKILPELLVGIKDTNEFLVSMTLRALADLVPVLGASIVIGRGRAKLFADGRPLVKNENHMNGDIVVDSNSLLYHTEYELTERPSPDGGEDSCEFFNSAIAAEESAAESEDSQQIPSPPVTPPVPHCAAAALATIENHVISTKSAEPPQVLVINKNSSLKLSSSSMKAKKHDTLIAKIEDLSKLDVKCSKSKNDSLDNDIEQMFKDMEPVISKTAVYKVSEMGNANKFKVAQVDCAYDEEGAWGDDATNWVNPEDEEIGNIQ